MCSGVISSIVSQEVRAVPLYFERLVRSGALVARAYALANQPNHPVYHCLYLALAEMEAVFFFKDGSIPPSVTSGESLRLTNLGNERVAQSGAELRLSRLSLL